jgi:hypothetical protein
MKRPSNQTLITHSAQLRPVWSTDAAKSDYSKREKANRRVINRMTEWKRLAGAIHVFPTRPARALSQRNCGWFGTNQ